MTTIDIKYLTQPHDGTPGKPWEDFEQRLMDVAAGKTDDRGWSLADCLNAIDEKVLRAGLQCPVAPQAQKLQQPDATASRKHTPW